jgi:DNA-binding response OmpR family regulator
MLTRPKILIVEDEPDVQNLMKIHLNRDGYDVIITSSAEEAIQFLNREPIDCAIFDWMLPGASGLKLCEIYNGKFPILLLTARAEATDIVLGLSVGADDYITKPFEIPVFLARVSALLRRKNWEKTNLKSKNLKQSHTELDLDAYKCLSRGEEIHLTPMEFKLLTNLFQNIGRVLTRETLVNYLQESDISVTHRTVDQHIFSLRKKLNENANFIETIRGVGYRISNMGE